MRRCPAAQIIMSQSPAKSMSMLTPTAINEEAGVERGGAAHQVPGLADPRRQGAGAKAARLIDERRPTLQEYLGELFGD
jgi:hypothetical protein